MSLRTDTRALILATLVDGPGHGYSISKAIRSRSQEVLKLGEGQLYPLLHEMEDAGWLVSNWEQSEGDPPRKVYVLTDVGRGELAKRVARWDAFALAVGSVLKPKEAV